MRTIALALLLIAQAQDKSIELTTTLVEKAPAIDGAADDAAWSASSEHKVTLWKPYDPSEKSEVRVRVSRTAEEIFVLLVWKDETKDVRHQPYVWKKDKQAYEELEDLCEDQAALCFELEGEFDPDMLAGKESKWDVWQWKAARTDPVGYAMDKLHQYSRANLGGKSRKFIGNDGKPVWILRAEDAGTSVTARVDLPQKYEADEVEQFKPQKPDGSAADVRAKGTWKDKTWTVEFARKLKTGHKDDSQFEIGKSYRMSLATLNRESNADHAVGPKLVLVIK